MRVLGEYEMKFNLLKEIQALKSDYYIMNGKYPTHIEMTSKEVEVLSRVCCHSSADNMSMRIYDMSVIIKD